MSDFHGFPIDRHAETIGHLQTQQGLYGVIKQPHNTKKQATAAPVYLFKRHNPAPVSADTAGRLFLRQRKPTMYGYDSYQDHRLQPRESWLDDQPSAESIAEELMGKYRAAAIAELEAMVKAGEMDAYSEDDICELALSIAEDNGETVETAMRDYQAEYIAALYAH